MIGALLGSGCCCNEVASCFDVFKYCPPKIYVTTHVFESLWQKIAKVGQSGMVWPTTQQDPNGIPFCGWVNQCDSIFNMDVVDQVYVFSKFNRVVLLRQPPPYQWKYLVATGPQQTGTLLYSFQHTTRLGYRGVQNGGACQTVQESQIGNVLLDLSGGDPRSSQVNPTGHLQVRDTTQNPGPPCAIDLVIEVAGALYADGLQITTPPMTNGDPCIAPNTVCEYSGTTFEQLSVNMRAEYSFPQLNLPVPMCPTSLQWSDAYMNHFDVLSPFTIDNCPQTPCFGGFSDRLRCGPMFCPCTRQTISFQHDLLIEV